MGKMAIERQTIVTWEDPAKKLPKECVFVVTSISFKSRSISYDHALAIGNWAEEDGWLFEDPIVNRYKDSVTVHAWADLEPYGG